MMPPWATVILKKAGGLFRALLDVKNGSLLLLLGFLGQQVGYDTCLRPAFDRMGKLETQLQELQNSHNQKEQQQHRLEQMSKDQAHLNVTLPVQKATDSLSVVAASLSDQLVSLVKGTRRVALLPQALPSPHDHLTFVTMTPKGNQKTTMDEYETAITTDAAAKPGASPPPPPPPANSGNGNPPGGGSPGSNGDKNGSASPSPDGSGNGAKPAAPEKLPSPPVWRYDYELQATGTYPAMVDLVNQLSVYPELVSIRGVTIASDDAGSLTLTLDLSLLISPAGTAPASGIPAATGGTDVSGGHSSRHPVNQF